MAKYELYEPALDNVDSAVMILKYELDISEVTARLLVNRGISLPNKAKVFLNPSIDQLHDPYMLNGMDRTVVRIRTAIENDEKIIVYGDYDVDGVTSVSMLHMYLRSQGARVDIYIPSRKDEGYGLHTHALSSLEREGAGLVITVDCGITAIEEVKSIQSKMDIIITDHHNPGEVLPAAYAIINPKLAGQEYPYKDLAGVGVAAKLIQALGGLRAINDYIDLVAIGTIADIVPLTGENRVLAALGLKAINENPRPGLKALITCLDLRDKLVDSGRVSFGIAPCLNAPGRMSTYRKGYELLVADRVEAAIPIARTLIDENESRKKTEAETLDSVLKCIVKQADIAHDKVLVVYGEGWHPGVIGIVASRVVERYNRPCIIISGKQDSDIGVASGRSIKDFDLFGSLDSCSDLFISFGGHEQAAGLSIQKDNIDEFRKRICVYADDHLDEEALLPRYFYDGELKSEDVSPELHREIDMLAPFGFGNPAPKFLIPTAFVESRRLIGKEENHLKLALAVGQRSWDAIGFNMADLDKELQPGCEVSLLASLKLNEWRGVSTSQLHFHSLQRNYRGIKDIDKLLSMFYQKHFNVFLTRFMYNDSRTLEKNDDYRVEFAGLDMGDLFNQLKDSQFGLAILVNTPYAAKELLYQLMELGMYDTLAVRYNLPNNEDGAGRNTIILAPDLTRFPAENYHTIMVPDSECGLVDANLEIFNKKKGFKVLMGDYPGRDRSVTADLAIDREQLTILYRWLKAIVPKRNLWASTTKLSQSLKAHTGCELNSFQLLLALETFKELNFIILEAGDQYIRVNLVDNPKNRQLSESQILTFHKSWFTGLCD
ncbi:MAG TPA: single-stranded-DNA-specific exonuclease RecJ [Bacillota bacterium]|nr:single-stranded-DNA-specific exonuclease RecJ [Bacillota bacterium]